MQFGSRFLHQLKGTAMGTPMAVNFANLFMSKFEDDMIQAYEREHNHRPVLWLRFIDDIFFIWNGDENSLKTFIEYCNQVCILQSDLHHPTIDPRQYSLI